MLVHSQSNESLGEMLRVKKRLTSRHIGKVARPRRNAKASPKFLDSVAKHGVMAASRSVFLRKSNYFGVWDLSAEGGSLCENLSRRDSLGEFGITRVIPGKPRFY